MLCMLHKCHLDIVCSQHKTSGYALVCVCVYIAYFGDRDLCSSPIPHFFSASGDDHTSMVVPSQLVATSPIGYLRLS